MRKHGWQLPYHPLQVVAIAVFLALGFAFYVFFLPFVGKKVFEYLVLGIYTPLATCVFGLYVWCGATDPVDPGVFKSKKYRKVKGHAKVCKQMNSRQEGSVNEAHGATIIDKSLDDDITVGTRKESSSQKIEIDRNFLLVLLGWMPLPLSCDWCLPSQHAHDHRTSEDGMFYCSLCEVEVGKYSKHCRVCDKCVDQFDHHCRWINNCVGRKNYRRFFVLMISALLLLILQWSIGILVLILSFLGRKQFSNEIIMKLGSSFSVVPFIVVVASCTFLAMLATLPLAQLFFFHVLLIKKGISTYDYIVALREQDQQGLGQQSPQMSSVSSLTGFSSASSFSAFQRGSWCTPPRLFVEDQFDVIHQESNAAVHSAGKKTMADQVKKETPGNIKISPWTLARLNAEEVSKAAAQARKKSKILQPIMAKVMPGPQTDGISDGCRTLQNPDSQRRASKRASKLAMELPLGPLAKVSTSGSDSNGSYLAAEASSSFAPLHREARCAFRPSRAKTNTNLVVASSPESSFDSPDLLPFQVSSSINEDSHVPMSVSSAATTTHKATELSRSTSDGYEASGGEDSDRVPSRIVPRPFNWSSLILTSDQCGRHGSGHAG